MKNLFYLLVVTVLSVLFQSCGVFGKIQRYEISQSEIVNSFVIQKSNERLWSDLVSFLSSTSYSIDMIDKESGLIVLKESSFIPFITHTSDIKEKNEKAYVVVSSFSLGNKLYLPNEVKGTIKIQVLKINELTSTLKISLTNLSALRVNYDTYSINTHSVRSTGKLENMFYLLLK
jgi:hypothetical protein